MRQALILAVLLLAGCVSGCSIVSTPPITSAPSACSSLLPEEWKQGVPSARLPDDQTVGGWITFGDAQTGQLDKANDRYKAGVGIVERCEARDREAVKRSKPGFFGRLFGG